MVLKELRKIYKVSMQELADNISVSKQLIGQIEKGKRVITDEVLNKLVKFFGLNKRITKDYRSFLTKDSMTKLELSKVKLAKIEKDSEDIEYEETDPYTGETYIAHHTEMDVTGHILTSYDILKEELNEAIETRLSSVINNKMKDQEENEEFVSIEYAISEASRKVEFYKKLINLDAKADSEIYEKLIRALRIVTFGGVDSDKFVRNLIKLISAELEAKEKERKENLKLWQEISGEDINV